MVSLNLPETNLEITVGDDGLSRVFDRLRRRSVVLTPEEWVRQHFVAYMLDVMGYPAGLTANEVSIRLNGTLRRCDTVVFDIHGRPVMIVEYKAPHVSISQRTFDQIVRYNMVLQARYLVVSNGLEHYCCEVDIENRSYRFLIGLPPYEAIRNPQDKK